MGRTKRPIGFLTLLYVLVIIFSVYGPYDFIGAKAKILLADRELYNGQGCIVSGQIYRREIKNNKPIFYIRDACIETSKSKIINSSVILYPDSDNIPIYSFIKLNGSISLFDIARNEGNFDAKKYYNSLGLVCAVKNISYVEYKTCGVSCIENLYQLKRQIAQVYEKYLPGEEAGFLSSVVVGDKSMLAGSLKELFSEVGVAHVLAVSGLHISLICMGIYGFLRKRGISFAFSSIMAAFVAIAYGVLTGGSVSSVRAIGMFCLFLLSQVLGESYDVATSLGIMAVYILSMEKMLITNAGFVFSFSAIMSIWLVVIPFMRSYDRVCERILEARIIRMGIGEKYKISSKDRLVKYLGAQLMFSFSITAATIPIVSNYYYQIPAYSFFVNFLLLPFMPILLGLGILAGLVSFAVEPISESILLLCHHIIYFFEMLADFFSKLPHSTIITGKPSVLKILLYYLILIIMANTKRIKELWKKIVISLAAILIFIAPTKHGFEIDIIDVGQGDGTYICDGDGNNIFIDGGSTDISEIGKYRIIPFLKYKQVDTIDYWFISHTDKDHYAGLIEVLDSNIKVENIVLSQKMPKDDDLKTIIESATKHNSNIIYMDYKDQVNSRYLKISCVHPTLNDSSIDKNELCLSLLLEFDKDLDAKSDFSAFFGGDISADSEKKIADRLGNKKIDFLKVSHHGSKTSTDKYLLQKCSPDFASISCGLKNSYGHPARETVEKLDEFGVRTFYTMYSGQVSIYLDKGNIIYKEYVND